MVREIQHSKLRGNVPDGAGYKELMSELSPFRRVGEQLSFFRFCMVMVSFTPLFVLIAIRGNDVVADKWTWMVCSSLIVTPMLLVAWRIRLVWRFGTKTEMVIGIAEDSRSHVLGYLFATMLPFYRSSIDQWRDLIALTVALAFILLLFWYLRWHYVNWLLLVLGYHVYTVTPSEDPGYLGRRTPFVLITRRVRPLAGERFYAKRISDTVYWETGV